MDVVGVQFAVISWVRYFATYAGLGHDDFSFVKHHVARAVDSTGACRRTQLADYWNQLERRRAGQGRWN